jgi:hypothetical protein
MVTAAAAATVCESLRPLLPQRDRYGLGLDHSAGKVSIDTLMRDTLCAIDADGIFDGARG